MKSVKEIVLDGLKYFRQALLSDTPVENDTTHALSLAGAYSLQSQINSLNSRDWHYSPLEKVTGSIGNFDEADNVLIVNGKIATITIRFSLSADTTTAVKLFKYKSSLAQYTPRLYGASNGVIFPVMKTWTGEFIGIMFINYTWEVGVGGGLKKNTTYVGQATYII